MEDGLYPLSETYEKIKEALCTYLYTSFPTTSQ